MVSRNHNEETKQSFEGKATRSEKLERLDLVPPELDMDAGRRLGLGAIKHGEGNWKNGGVAFIKACINHARIHECELLAHDPDQVEDDNLSAIVCNWAMICWFRKNKATEYKQALKELREGIPQ